MRESDGCQRVSWLGLTAAIGLWLLAIVFLWLPGLSNVAVPHAGYERHGYGLLCYYAVDKSKGVILRTGIRPLNLLTTIALTVLATALVVHDVKGGLKGMKQRE